MSLPQSTRVRAVVLISLLISIAVIVLGLLYINDSEPRAGGSDVRRPGRADRPGETTRTGNSPGATYHVAKTNCSNSGRGSSSEPLCSIQRGIDKIRAGETLLIHNGTYYEHLIIKRSGTPDAPISIRGESRRRVILDGGCRRFPCRASRVFGRVNSESYGIYMRDRDNIFIRNLTVRNVPANGINAERTSNLTLEDLVVRRTGMSGINVYDSSNLSVRSNRISRSNLGVRRSDSSVWSPEESLTIVNTSDFDVSYNRLYDSIKEGIDVKVGSRKGGVHHNRVTRMCAVGIYINEGHDVKVYRNRIFSSGRYKVGRRTVRCSSIPRYGDNFGKYFGDGLLLAVGDLGDLSKGKLSNVQVFENVVAGANLNCLEFWDELKESGTGTGQMKDNKVYNNVFYDCGRAGIGSGMRLDDASNTTVVNNIFALNEEAGITGNSVKKGTVSYNLFYRAGQSAGDHRIFGNPRFVNTRKRNFHLRKGSPAIDAGIDTGLPSAGRAPDLGAYEFGSSD